MNSFSRDQVKDFANRWLPAWSGNKPDELIAFYTKDAFYSDPANVDGLRGQDQILDYFRKLLAKNPNWEWKQVEAIPMEDGFVNIWDVTSPVGDELVTIRGCCLVQLRDGLIYRNEVYFDPSRLFSR